MPKKFSIADMHKIAESKGGKFLSLKYLGASKKHKWQCKEGHVFEQNANSIRSRGNWCPICGRKRGAEKRKLSIDEMQQIAKSKGGSCLSTEYIDANTKLKWQCKDGHVWDAAPVAVKHVSWCPECASFLSERVCRKFFESIFKEKFPKARPKWMMSDEGGRMEFDGYSPKLRLAFEYQGIQHYETKIVFHRGKRTLANQQERDEMKRIACQKNNVVLIEVPYTVPYGQMLEYIIRTCRDKGVYVPAITSRIDFRQFDVSSPQIIKELQEIAKSKGGKCLSERYLGKNVKLKWQCKEGHVWEAEPSSLIWMKSWCPTCAGKAMHSLMDAQEAARKHGGRCLSSEYINSKTPLDWECNVGHHWSTPLGSVLNRGDWCKKCGDKRGSQKRKLKLDVYRQIAESRGGKCLSGEEDYVNKWSKLKFECAKGHAWNAQAGNVKNNGSWCPKCSGHAKLTLQDMQQIAESRGGKCLSTEWVDSKTKMRWRCKAGHEWETTPFEIKYAGSWCRKCAVIVNANKRRLGIDKMRELAATRGGKCLSTQYINVKTKLTWQCAKGHVWEAIQSNIKKGTWCPCCIGRNQTIEDMQKLAEKKGGKCLSTEYVHCNIPLTWRCAKGHVWKARPSNIKNGTWCPFCFRMRKKLTIEDMRQLAESLGGKCLSTKYTNNHVKLTWKCAKGHVWDSAPNNVKARIKTRTWCPLCFKVRKYEHD